MEFEWDADNPLARAIRETRKANDALNTYFGLGYGRSLSKLSELYKESGKRTRFRTLASWSQRYYWQVRISAQSEVDNAADREYWAKQRRDIRQADLKASIALRERAEQMRKFPLAQVEKVEQTYPDGRVKTVTIVRVWSTHNAPAPLNQILPLGRKRRGRWHCGRFIASGIWRGGGNRVVYGYW